MSSTSESTPSMFASALLLDSASLSVEKIASLISLVNTIPDYVRKLERKLVAAERSNHAKAKRISDLELDIERFVATSNIHLKTPV